MGFWVTINLLKTSTLVAISGAFRLSIASYLLGIEASILVCIAGGFVIYTIYTLDRTLECKEDTVNRSELTGSRKDIALCVSISVFCIGTFILFMHGLYIMPFLPLIVGYLYTKGANIFGFNLKLKGSLGIKNLVVALTWGTFITGIAGKSVDNIISQIFVFYFFSSKVFINSVIYDFKDVKGDSLAGIRTLPVRLGEKKTIDLLLIMHLTLHLSLCLAIVKNLITFEPIILIYSFIAGITCITHYSIAAEIESNNRRFIREFLVDGESITAIILRQLINSLLSQEALIQISKVMPGYSL